MATEAEKATYLANDIEGIQTYSNTGAATSKLKVKSLLDLVTLNGTMTQRGALDEMSPACRVQLVAELTALYTAIGN